MIASSKKIRILRSGDSAYTIMFGNEISVKTNCIVRGFIIALQQAESDGTLSGVIEWVPAFCSVTVYFSVLRVSKRSKLLRKLRKLAETCHPVALADRKVCRVPVCYDQDVAPDMDYVCLHTGLTRDVVIKLHTEREYLVYMLGFLPGFVYLGGMNEKLATPRLATPRVQIEPGSVGIAGKQTGIYPLSSPGGWQLIGRTPIKLYDPNRNSPALFKAGDYLKFESISFDEYNVLAKKNRSDLNNITTDSSSSIGNSVTVLTPGALTTVQDAGRPGYQKDGFSISGAMDNISYRLVNIIAGNPPGTAVLETTMLGPRLQFEQDSLFVITGADQKPTLNGLRIPLYVQVYAEKGSILSLGFSFSGLRSYIAFSGGIAVPKMIGSRSTSIAYKLGGYRGRSLEKGDVLPLFTQDISAVQRYPAIPVPSELLSVIASEEESIDRQSSLTLRVTDGPQKKYLSVKDLHILMENEYVVSGDSDRMGLRLKGPAIKGLEGIDILSEAVAAGSVQIPSSGEPIIMAADRQTVGGYIKPVTVITADLPKLGQLQPGSRIRFRFVSVGTAVRILKRQEECLQKFVSELTKEQIT